MPRASIVTKPTAASFEAAQPPPFLCTWQTGARAAWISVAGELDLASAPQLRQTLREAQLDARVVVLDLRDLAFIDSSGVHVILQAARDARREGHRLLLTRGPTQVDRVLTLMGVTEQVTIFELYRTEPAPALLATRAA